MSDLKVGDLAVEVRRELWVELNKEFRRRDQQGMGKEAKLRATVDLLRCLEGFTLPQKRAILRFAGEVVEHANKRFWRSAGGGPARP